MRERQKRPAGLGGAGVFGFSARRAPYFLASPQSPRRPAPPACHHHPAFHARRKVRAPRSVCSFPLSLGSIAGASGSGVVVLLARSAAEVGSLCSGVLVRPSCCPVLYVWNLLWMRLDHSRGLASYDSVLSEFQFTGITVIVNVATRVVGLERFQ